MNKFLWDGEMDYGWEDLSQKIVDTSFKFVSTLSEIIPFSPNTEVQLLISPECMHRFQNIATKLSEEIQNGPYYQYNDIDNINDNASKLNSWILLGSLTESTLQIFLAFYIEDYKRSKWQQWEEIDLTDIQNTIISFINSLVQQQKLSSKQAKSLKKAFQSKLDEHTNEHSVEKITLDEIIQYYASQGLMDEDELSYLRIIQSNRNGIHSFQKRTLGTWNDLQYCVRFWCYLLDWILDRLPDIPDC